MRIAGALLAGFVAVAVAMVIVLTFADDTSAPDASLLFGGATVTATVAPSPTAALPATWIDALDARPRSSLGPVLLSCLDANADGRLTERDGPPIYAGAEIALKPGEDCIDPAVRADFFESLSGDFSCDDDAAPVIVYIIAGAGTHLLDARGGESLGLLDTHNLLLAEAERRGIPLRYVLSTAAVFGADMAQTSMERMIAGHLAERLTDTPCARAVLIGHSHGGVTITSVLHAIEYRFAGRVLGVLVDRTPALYDRPAQEIPSRAQIFNFFQTNEGWHGVPIESPNVRNFDESAAIAPIAVSDGGPAIGGPPAIVTHKTLDDSPAVQARMVAEIINWLIPPP